MKEDVMMLLNLRQWAWPGRAGKVTYYSNGDVRSCGDEFMVTLKKRREYQYGERRFAEIVQGARAGPDGDR
jgi:hypothetical protein